MTTNNKNIWFILKSGKKEGPYNIENLKEMIGLNQINQKTFLWKPGLTNWMAAISFKELFDLDKIDSNIKSQVNENIESFRNQSELLNKSIQIDSAITSKTIDRIPQQPAQQLKRKSYISKHWHGDLSLPISFWVNGFLLNVLLLTIIKLTPWDTFSINAPRVVSVIGILFWIFFTPISIWQLVGIWNSSSNYKKSGNSKIVGNFVKFIVIINLINSYSTITKSAIPQVKEFFSIAIGHDPIGEYHLRVLRDATELEVSGPIVFGLTDDVKKILNAHPSIKIIHLNSIGGRVSEARKLRDLIDSRKLTTYTSTGCSSACTLTFAGGYKRLIAKGAYLGFHQYTFPGVQNENFNSEYEKDKKDWLNRGFSRSFIDKAFTTPNNEMWKPSHKELFEANFITGYPEDDEIAISGVSLNDIENIATELVKDPMYSSIKTNEPKIYDQIVSVIKLNLQKGKSLSELQQVTRPYLRSILYKRLPYSPDNSLFKFVKILLEQMEILYKVDSDICYNYVFGGEQDVPNFVKYFPSELIKKELETISEIIVSSSKSLNPYENEEQTKTQFAEVVKKLTEKYGEDIKLLSNPELRIMNKTRSCELTYDLYIELLKLPLSEFGQILRYLFALGIK